MRILVVDDNRLVRMIACRMCEKAGHQVRGASSGDEALELFDAETPDIVLLDVVMPGLSGWEVAEQIRARPTTSYVPIIFLTALEDEALVGRCLEAGGDEVLHKPVSESVLRARISTLERLSNLTVELERRNAEIEAHHQRMVHEQDIARRVFDRIVSASVTADENVRAALSPMAMFNGDIVISTPLAPNGVRVLIGDFTGHGLPAAIGAVPLTELFHGLTARGCSLGELIAKTNARLSTILPTGLFCAACALEVVPSQGLLRVWNGGLPDGYLIPADGSEPVQLPPRHPALGVLPASKLDTSPDVLSISPGDRVYFATDGLSESTDAAGEVFGETRFKTLLFTSPDRDRTFDVVLDALHQFSDGDEQDDDITLVEVTCPEPVPVELPTIGEDADTPAAMPWRTSIELDAMTLARVDPLPILLDMMTRVQGLRQHRSQVFTILTELFINAVDHGLLGLDSTMKATPAGFAEYYRQREAALRELRAGRIAIYLDHSATRDGGRLSIRVEDSGPGFDHFDLQVDLEQNVGNASRGIALLHRLCERVEYIGHGNIVEAVYRWSHAAASSSSRA